MSLVLLFEDDKRVIIRLPGIQDAPGVKYGLDAAHQVQLSFDYVFG